MAQLTFNIKYRKNTGLVISVAELWELFLYGIKIQGGEGSNFSDESMRFYLVVAQREIENYYNLKFIKQLADQTITYYRTDYWQTFPILQTNYPVREPLSMIGMLNKMEQIVYPQGWLFCEYDTLMGQGKRRISVVPTGSSTRGNAEIILTGITSQVGMQRFNMIPDYWRIQYITGWDIDQMPMDLINVVGMVASFGPLGIAGDLILGSAGIASQSLSIDGLSQSISTTASATNAGYGARLIQYEKQIKETTDRLKLVYDQPKFMVM
jgi:hypothetical protein|nr:MAG TPA: hypothetical protein [Caudoviricetes sp.]